MTEPERLNDLPIMLFETPAAWEEWLAANHESSAGVWLRHAKKAAALQSVSYAEALDVALCYGWIDSQKKTYNDDSWVQRWSPRGRRSIWSKVNREKVAALEAAGRMQPAGVRAVEEARQDGRWEAAYDSQRNASVPEDFQAALDASPAAAAFFATLKSANRYAMLFRIQTAKKPETRAKRIAQFIEMLENQQTLH